MTQNNRSALMRHIFIHWNSIDVNQHAACQVRTQVLIQSDLIPLVVSKKHCFIQFPYLGVPFSILFSCLFGLVLTGSWVEDLVVIVGFKLNPCKMISSSFMDLYTIAFSCSLSYLLTVIKRYSIMLITIDVTHYN